MNVLVVGDKEDADKLFSMLAEGSTIMHIVRQDLQKHSLKFDVIFDFHFAYELNGLGALTELEVPIFINAPFTSLRLQRHVYPGFIGKIYGFNGLPGFFTDVSIELSATEEDKSELEKLSKKIFKTPFHIVQDRVGLVTPRVICMIINEAFYTIQEGTASREDIDKAMKLGTNYPFGPFEWTKMIGIENVFTLLSAMYEDTGEERYKVCPLLKTKYLKAIQQ